MKPSESGTARSSDALLRHLRIAIVDDQRSMAGMLQMLFERIMGLKVVAISHTCADAL